MLTYLALGYGLFLMLSGVLCVLSLLYVLGDDIGKRPKLDDGVYRCPTCKYFIAHVGQPLNNYCPRCGQKIRRLKNGYMGH